MKTNWLMVVHFFLTSIVTSQAATYTWTGLGGSNWNNTANWSSGILPGTADTANLKSNGVVYITTDVGQITAMSIGATSIDNTLTVASGGAVKATGISALGTANAVGPSLSTLNVQGSVTVSNTFQIGSRLNGIINVDGSGALTVSGLALGLNGGTGTLNVTGNLSSVGVNLTSGNGNGLATVAGSFSFINLVLATNGFNDINVTKNISLAGANDTLSVDVRAYDSNTYTNSVVLITYGGALTGTFETTNFIGGGTLVYDTINKQIRVDNIPLKKKMRFSIIKGSAQ